MRAEHCISLIGKRPSKSRSKECYLEGAGGRGGGGGEGEGEGEGGGGRGGGEG